MRLPLFACLREKLLTQKHTNTAFTRELMTASPGLAGVKCPRGLRAHYLGLQNFEYDWGVGRSLNSTKTGQGEKYRN